MSLRLALSVVLFVCTYRSILPLEMGSHFPTNFLLCNLTMPATQKGLSGSVLNLCHGFYFPSGLAG